MNINPENLTPHFRNLLRDENPSWDLADILKWSWSVETPLFCGKPLDIREFDSRHPGGSAIGRMLHDIRTNAYPLTLKTRFHGVA